jgi:hypothetical protein
MRGAYLENRPYLLDTHALLFWNLKEAVSGEFVEFFDAQANQSNLLVSSVSFWEVALLVKKGRLNLADLHRWKTDLIALPPHFLPSFLCPLLMCFTLHGLKHLLSR